MMILAPMLVASLVSTSASEPTGGKDQDPALNPLATLSLSGLTGFLDRPLFSSTRSSPKVVDPVAEPTPDARDDTSEPPPLRLLGVVHTPRETIARVVQTDSGEGHSLRLGDYLGSWRVESITTKSVTLIFEGRQLQVLLRPESPISR